LDDYLFETYIMHDDLSLTVNRSEYSFFVWLAMLGGISKIIKQYCAIITDAVSKKMFLNSILKDLFFVKSRAEDDEAGEKRDAMSVDEIAKLHSLVK